MTNYSGASGSFAPRAPISFTIPYANAGVIERISKTYDLREFKGALFENIINDIHLFWLTYCTIFYQQSLSPHSLNGLCNSRSFAIIQLDSGELSCRGNKSLFMGVQSAIEKIRAIIFEILTESEGDFEPVNIMVHRKDSAVCYFEQAVPHVAMKMNRFATKFITDESFSKYIEPCLPDLLSRFWLQYEPVEFQQSIISHQTTIEATFIGFRLSPKGCCEKA